jgi:hypothetical protein
VLSVSLAAAEKPLSVSVWLAPATSQQNEYIYDYGYQDASVVVNHRAVMAQARLYLPGEARGPRLPRVDC